MHEYILRYTCIHAYMHTYMHNVCERTVSVLLEAKCLLA